MKTREYDQQMALKWRHLEQYATEMRKQYAPLEAETFIEMSLQATYPLQAYEIRRGTPPKIQLR